MFYMIRMHMFQYVLYDTNPGDSGKLFVAFDSISLVQDLEAVAVVSCQNTEVPGKLMSDALWPVLSLGLLFYPPHY